MIYTMPAETGRSLMKDCRVDICRRCKLELAYPQVDTTLPVRKGKLNQVGRFFKKEDKISTCLRLLS